MATNPEMHACIHSFHGYLLSTYNVHCTWCEDTAMNKSDKTLPSWSLHSKMGDRKTKKPSRSCSNKQYDEE